MVKNPPANAGDTGSSPGTGGSHMPRSNWVHAPQLLSLHSRAREPKLLKPVHLKPVLCNGRGHHSEKLTHPVHRNKEQSLLTATRERPCAATDPTQPKINK